MILIPKPRSSVYRYEPRARTFVGSDDAAEGGSRCSSTGAAALQLNCLPSGGGADSDPFTLSDKGFRQPLIVPPAEVKEGQQRVGWVERTRMNPSLPFCSSLPSGASDGFPLTAFGTCRCSEEGRR